MFIPEKFLRHIWRFQRLQKSLKTTDGRALNILSLGTFNTHAGPDFLNAKLVIGEVHVEGDIEIHSLSSSWHKHKHSTDSRYDSVVLNVVFDNDVQLLHAPTLELKHFLNDSLHKVIVSCIKDEQDLQKTQHIPCHPLNLDVPISERMLLLEALALDRLFRKGNDLMSNSFSVLNEFLNSPKMYLELKLIYGICVALGYSTNTKPMARLAERFLGLYPNMILLKPSTFTEQRAIIEAILFLLSGLVPLRASFHPHCETTSSDDRESELEQFKKYASIVNGLPFQLPKPLGADEWMFFRLRPFNFPTLRIAGFAEIVARHLQQPFIEVVKDVAKSSISLKRKVVYMESLFLVEPYAYWKTHFRFSNKASRVPSLIGSSRASEIVINVLLPLMYAEAKQTNDETGIAATLDIFKNYPKQVASTLSLETVESYLGSDFTVKSGFVEQGILELRKNFCNEFKCLECNIGTRFLNR
ncbi:hypothetical protein CHS0354_000770 [Potamilus streckersoni]|uniref:DUF2851 family protein n=1 Tax=Potamilus streckersoni TaxID=2493646 RepID=A0AAE0T7X8_9BIVA|nr:hypothetical protein CHS0354_000770 [Potamilus streckersoni]